MRKSRRFKYLGMKIQAIMFVIYTIRSGDLKGKIAFYFTLIHYVLLITYMSYII